MGRRSGEHRDVRSPGWEREWESRDGRESGVLGPITDEHGGTLLLLSACSTKASRAQDGEAFPGALEHHEHHQRHTLATQRLALLTSRVKHT